MKRLLSSREVCETYGLTREDLKLFTVRGWARPVKRSLYVKAKQRFDQLQVEASIVRLQDEAEAHSHKMKRESFSEKYGRKSA